MGSKLILSDEEIYKLISDRKINKKRFSETYARITGKVLHEDEARKRLKGLEEVIGERLEYQSNTEFNGTKPRLVISDLHFPFVVDGWLDFIKDTHKKYNCHEEIIINGDLLDFHAVSFHTKEPDGYTLNEEFEKSFMYVEQLFKEFPNAIWLLGNHDIRIQRQNKELGIHERFLKTFHQLFDLPDTVKIKNEIVIDDVYYRHIGCSGGKDGAINSAVSNRMSTVVSHLHSYGGVKYITSPNGEMIFGLNTGCLFDEETYAGRYGQFSRFKGTLGCGIVYNKTRADFIPFTLEDN